MPPVKSNDTWRRLLVRGLPFLVVVLIIVYVIGSILTSALPTSMFALAWRTTALGLLIYIAIQVTAIRRHVCGK